MRLSILLRHCAIVVCAVAANIGFEGSAAAALPSVESFFQNSGVNGALLSPDGRLVALRAANKEHRLTLAVLKLETMKLSPVASYNDGDVGEFDWVNEHRLVFSMADLVKGKADVHVGPACSRSTATAAACASWSSAATIWSPPATRPSCCRGGPICWAVSARVMATTFSPCR